MNIDQMLAQAALEESNLRLGFNSYDVRAYSAPKAPVAAPLGEDELDLDDAEIMNAVCILKD